MPVHAENYTKLDSEVKDTALSQEVICHYVANLVIKDMIFIPLLRLTEPKTLFFDRIEPKKQPRRFLID